MADRLRPSYPRRKHPLKLRPPEEGTATAVAFLTLGWLSVLDYRWLGW